MSLGLDLPAIDKPETKKETITYERTKQSSNHNHKGRLALPEHLPRVDQLIPPLEDVTGLKIIGEEITERLECDLRRKNKHYFYAWLSVLGRMLTMNWEMCWY